MEINKIIQFAEILLSCKEFQSTFDVLTKQFLFRVECIFPADEPQYATLVGYGLKLQLERNGMDDNTTIILRCQDPNSLLVSLNTAPDAKFVAPNGTSFVIRPLDNELNIPDLVQDIIVCHHNTEDGSIWKIGRAGMRYRDLIPGRLGGRYIASHIHIPTGGVVPDYVHYHKVRFQMIFCYKGWVRVVYEDQGPPFVLEAGDCVIQPPQIRHRVLESSDDLHVIELGSPAIHHTLAEFSISLPNDNINPDRIWDGQQFVRFQNALNDWNPCPASSLWGQKQQEVPQWLQKDCGIYEATNGLASIRLLQPASVDVGPLKAQSHDYDLLFIFVLEGSIEVAVNGSKPVQSLLQAGSSICIPNGEVFYFGNWTTNTQLLEVCIRQ